jgi:hypothetical protein
MDTRDTRFQNLLFLLSAAPIGLGCVISGDDSDTAAETETPTTNNDTTGNTTGSVDTDDPPVTEGTGSTGPVADTGSSGPSVDSSSGGLTTGGIELPPACATYADAITLCYDEKAGAAAGQYCAESFAYYEMNYGAECVTAFEEWLACLSALTCKELMGKEVCVEQGMALETACAAK